MQVDPLLVEPSPHRIVAAESPEIAAKEKTKLTAVRTDISQGADNIARPSAKSLAKRPVPAATVAQVPKTVAPAPVVGTLEPPLDMAALKLRLRDTNAIGVFTKLALKNQVDDLLQQFRSHYLSGQQTGVAKLRQPYDLLVLKVLALVQDGDPLLARTISGSREAIWIILADPEQFKLVT